MASSSPETDLAYFGFKDLHGFKDFMIEVIAGAPDDFMEMDWLKPEEQMNLDRAFVGLHYGLDLTASETRKMELVERCRQLVEEAYAEYKAGRTLDGQRKLEDVDRLISELPSR